MKTRTLLFLLLGVVVLSVAPLFLARDAEFGGADGQAEEVILTINPDYKPWFKSLWEPPSAEVESLLFALQAAVGSGIVFFVFGYYAGKKSRGKEHRIVRS